jgi:WD40 repeat protein
VRDLAELVAEKESSDPIARRGIRKVVEQLVARSLEFTGPEASRRYFFAHVSLLDYVRADPDLGDRQHREKVDAWARRWAQADWPLPDDQGGGTPRYLLDTYPATLDRDPVWLAALAGNVSWAEAAITSAGADRVIANLAAAAVAAPGDLGVAAVRDAVMSQARNLRPAQLEGTASGYVLRQLWTRAAGLGEGRLAGRIRDRLQSRPGCLLVPQWTTRRENRALVSELGTHEGGASAMAVLPDGRLATADYDRYNDYWDGRRVLVWAPASPGGAPEELGTHEGGASAMVVLPDGKLVTAHGDNGRVLVWAPASPGAAPEELAIHDRGVSAMVVLPDGRLVTAHGDNGRVLVWAPASPGAAPEELGIHDRGVSAMAVLPDGKLVTATVFIDGGYEDYHYDYDGGKVLVWDPASPRTSMEELGVRAMAVLPDGRLATADYDYYGSEGGRVLVWDPASPRAAPEELVTHDRGVSAMAVLPDGKLVTAHGGRVLVWDPASPGGAPEELVTHDRGVSAMAVLPDGRLATADDGYYSSVGGARVLVWDLASPGASPEELGTHEGGVSAMAVLPDGRLATADNGHYGSVGGRVLVWDPASPGAAPEELVTHHRGVRAMAVLPDGKLATADNGGWVLAWGPNQESTPITWLNCQVRQMAVTQNVYGQTSLAIAHPGGGLSIWSIIAPCP